MRAIERVVMVAAQQSGAVSVAQMRECGLSWKARRTVVSTGQLQFVEPCVVIVAGSPDTWHRRLRVGLLALGPEAWVSHEAAAAMHGLDRAIPGAVEFTVPRRCRRTLSVGRVHTTEHIGRLDVVTVNGFPCSSATRTIVDLAASGIPPIRLEAAIDSSVHFGLSATRVLEERLNEMRGSGRRGVTLLERLLVDSGGETLLERRFLTLVRTNSLPRPTTQVRVRNERGLVGRVDFLFEPYRVVVEVSGRKGHSSPTERQRDAQRRNELLDRGYLVFEYTRQDVEERAPMVAATMRARLIAAGWAPQFPVHVD